MLRFLYCDNNKLKSLPVLPKTLVRIDCYRNNLTSLPPSLLECRDLKYFDGDNNWMEDIPYEFSEFIRLTTGCESPYSSYFVEGGHSLDGHIRLGDLTIYDG